MPRHASRFEKMKIRTLRHGRGGRLVADVVVWAGGKRFERVIDCGRVICSCDEMTVSCDGLDMNPTLTVIGVRTDRVGYASHHWWLSEGDVLVAAAGHDEGGFRRVPANWAAEVASGGSRKPVRVSRGQLVREALHTLHNNAARWL